MRDSHVCAVEVGTPTVMMGFKREESQIELHALFWSIWRERGYRLPQEASTGLCYHFQLASREHRYQVKYGRNELYLAACFDLVRGIEVAPEAVAADNGWACVRTFPELRTKADVLQAARTLNPFRLKGARQRRPRVV